MDVPLHFCEKLRRPPGHPQLESIQHATAVLFIDQDFWLIFLFLNSLAMGEETKKPTSWNAVRHSTESAYW